MAEILCLERSQANRNLLIIYSVIAEVFEKTKEFSIIANRKSISFLLTTLKNGGTTDFLHGINIKA